MSKVSLGPVDRLHERLQSKGGSYHKWHSSKVHHFVHWAVFIMLVLGTFFGSMALTGQTSAGSVENVNTDVGTGDPVSSQTLMTDKDSAVANGTDAITISAKFLAMTGWPGNPDASPSNPRPDCDFTQNPPSCASFKIVVSGSGNLYNSDYITIDSNTGIGSTTLTSTVAETKTVGLWQPGKGGGQEILTLSINVGFVTSSSVTPPSNDTPTSTPVPTSSGNTGSSTTQKKTTQTPTTSVPVPEAAPASPEMSLVKISDNEVDSTTKTASSTVEEGKSIVLSGKTTPNSKVTLYIYSDPIVVETTSDKDGFWSYEIASLPPGDHRVEAAVTDSAGKTSGKAEIAKFVVAEAQSVEKTDKVLTPKSNNNILYLLISIGVVLLAVIGGVVFYVRKKKRPVQG